MKFLLRELFQTQKGVDNMGYVIEFPCMSIMNETEYVGDISKVEYADDELVMLINRFFELRSQYRHYKDGILSKFLPLPIRNKKLNNISAQLEDCRAKITDKVRTCNKGV